MTTQELTTAATAARGRRCDRGPAGVSRGARPGCPAGASPRRRAPEDQEGPTGGAADAPTAVRPTTPGSRVRLLPVPVSAPPAVLPDHPGVARGDRYPHQHAGQHPGQQVLVLPGAPGHRPPWSDADPLVAARASTHAQLPDPAGTCGALAGAVVEVLSGHRPAAQLVRWTTLEVHAELQRRAALAARLRPARPSRRPSSPSGAGASRAGRPAVVRRVHVCRPSEGVVEASAVVVDGDRVRAVALRLEGWDRRWRATAVEVG
ncbi:Rv3235 family protein [Pseudokineococcus basanitobsidens]|uniref:Rv3235 family protein n=1 Tax=Pseudokineococcus basanitobsidens TaxID=1926649 RepID=A0ABU8RM32_9ACTN